DTEIEVRLGDVDPDMDVRRGHARLLSSRTFRSIALSGPALQDTGSRRGPGNCSDFQGGGRDDDPRFATASRDPGGNGLSSPPLLSEIRMLISNVRTYGGKSFDRTFGPNVNPNVEPPTS